MGKDLPAREWRLGDVIVPADGSPRKITLHRLQGAQPASAVVQFAGSQRDHHYPLDHVETIER